MELDNLIEKLVKRIKELPDYTKTTLIQLMDEEEHLNFNMEEIFSVYTKIKNICESEDVLLISNSTREFTRNTEFYESEKRKLQNF